MNVWGKVLAVLVVITAVLATIFTAKLITVRNSWTAKTQSFEKNFQQADDEARKATQQLKLVLDEKEQLNREWGTAFNAAGGVNSQLLNNPPDGRIEVGLGANHGLKEGQVLHGFELQADGASIYRGPFKVLPGTQAERCAVQPHFFVRAGEVNGWKSGLWRWRSSVPSGYSSRSDDLQISFTRADETLADRRNSLAIQDRLTAEADAGLARRRAELVGGGQLTQEPAVAAEFRVGLVSTVAATEEERNTVLLEIADLRQKVRAARDAVQLLQQKNRELIQKLPQPPTDITRSE